jgi:adenylate kinase family enzyme
VDRIAIIGCGGSGKSHLARELGILLDIMPAHLDRLYYDRDWNPVEQQRFAALQRDLVSAPRWIIDGNYAATLPIRLEAADTVIFLDLPAWGCLWGVAQRRLRHGGGQHDAIGVYDRITWNFIRYIGGYRRHMAPRVRQLIAAHAPHIDVVILRDRRAVRRYLAEVAAPVSTARATAADKERN